MGMKLKTKRTRIFLFNILNILVSSGNTTFNTILTAAYQKMRSEVKLPSWEDVNKKLRELINKKISEQIEEKSCPREVIRTADITGKNSVWGLVYGW